jgi:hypothetical protein
MLGSRSAFLVSEWTPSIMIIGSAWQLAVIGRGLNSPAVNLLISDPRARDLGESLNWAKAPLSGPSP